MGQNCQLSALRCQLPGGLLVAKAMICSTWCLGRRPTAGSFEEPSGHRQATVATTSQSIPTIVGSENSSPLETDLRDVVDIRLSAPWKPAPSCRSRFLE